MEELVGFVKADEFKIWALRLSIPIVPIAILSVVIHKKTNMPYLITVPVSAIAGTVLVSVATPVIAQLLQLLQVQNANNSQMNEPNSS